MDVTEMRAQVGQATQGDGTKDILRLTRNLALLGANSQSAFQAAVERGNVFAVANQAGVTSQAGLSATTPVLTLANPAGSGKNLILWYAGASFTVAFATAGAIFAAVGTNTIAAAVTGTKTTAHRNLKLGGGEPSIVPLLAATLPAAPVAVGILGAGLTGAITTIPGVPSYERWFNGSIIITPGTNFSLQTGVASGASGMFCEYVWEEVNA